MKSIVKIPAAVVAVFLCLSAPGLLLSSDAAPGPSSAEERVERIAGKIENVTGRKAKITVVNDPGKEACVLPDGTIVLTSGLVSSCGSDDEIAFVIAHEMSHFIAKDYDRDLATSKRVIPSKADPGLAGAAPHYLPSEINADLRAVDFSKMAGYDPAAGERLLVRLSKEGVNEPAETLAALGRRIKTLNAYLKGGNPPEEGNPLETSEDR